LRAEKNPLLLSLWAILQKNVGQQFFLICYYDPALLSRKRETAEKVFNAAKMFPLWRDHAYLRRARNDKKEVFQHSPNGGMAISNLRD
jgi:hypothetical protein